MNGLCFVTGANGHLGNNLVRALLAQGKKVRAGIRNLNGTSERERQRYREPFKGLDCELVSVDLHDKNTLYQALEGVDTLYQLAAVFKHWAPDPEQEIIQANLLMTRNILEVAAEQGVRKVVYVSSIAALDRTVLPMDESSWNQDFSNPYFQAKTVSEQLAWQLADRLNLPLVTVLPSAIIGPNTFGRLTNTMIVFKHILDNKLPFDPGLHFNFVYVTDVVAGMINAAEKGRNGERYVLATDSSVAIREVIEIAQSLLPQIIMPPVIDYDSLMKIAAQAELESETTGQHPLLIRSNVALNYHADLRFDISKARNELGYRPMPPAEAIQKTLFYLKDWREG